MLGSIEFVPVKILGHALDESAEIVRLPAHGSVAHAFLSRRHAGLLQPPHAKVKEQEFS
ncbi:MAG: hypothetical protein J6I40_02415 [Mailhella sp.]|nr:hypothetical protein [Mailhella sp.]